MSSPSPLVSQDGGGSRVLVLRAAHYSRIRFEGWEGEGAGEDIRVRPKAPEGLTRAPHTCEAPLGHTTCTCSQATSTLRACTGTLGHYCGPES